MSGPAAAAEALEDPCRALVKAYVEAWRDAPHDRFPPGAPTLGRLEAFFQRALAAGAPFAELHAVAVDMGTRGEYSMRRAAERRRAAARAQEGNSMSSDMGERTPPLVRGVLEYYGAGNQPAPKSYTREDLAGWLLVGAAGMRTEMAAVVFLIGRAGSWLDRPDWRARCVTVVDGPGKRRAMIEWTEWRNALDESATYEACGAEMRERVPRGLEASTTARAAAEFAAWLSVDPLGIRRFDQGSMRAAAAALAVLCGSEFAEVFGGSLAASLAASTPGDPR